MIHLVSGAGIRTYYLDQESPPITTRTGHFDVLFFQIKYKLPLEFMN